ncbi:MAG TPA: hypothetical protein DER56_06015 [Thermosipho africanus]|nr:hypothetical protein [Thermosipho africanus]
MKKIICIIIAVAMLCSVATGCGKNKAAANTENNQDTETNLVESGAIILDNGLYVNPAYNKQKMTTVIGKEIETKGPYSYCDKGLGFGFIYVNTFGKIKDESDKIGGVCTVPYSLMLFYSSEESNKLQESCTDEVYNNMSEQERKEFIQKINEQTLNIAGIFRFPDKDDNAKAQFEFFCSRFEKVEELLKYNGDTYYFGYTNDYSKMTLSEQEKSDINALIEDLNEFKQNIVIYPPVSREQEAKFQGNLNKFDAYTLSGEKVTQDALKNYELTMVNIWSTTCEPCIAEMPELENLYKKLPENINLLSVCIDGADDVELTKEIVNDAKGEFVVIFPDENMKKSLTDNISCVPTTVFVDKNGNMVGEPLLGVPDPTTASEHYLEKINEIINGGK